MQGIRRCQRDGSSSVGGFVHVPLARGFVIHARQQAVVRPAQFGTHCVPNWEALNTPDLVQGSRNRTVGLAQGLAPPWLVAHASAKVSRHPVSELGWGEDLVVGQVRDAGQHIRVAATEREAG